MKFEQVLPALREGKKIRRENQSDASREEHEEMMDVILVVVGFLLGVAVSGLRWYDRGFEAGRAFWDNPKK